MKRWKGLFVREWLLMKRWFYATIVLTILFTFLFPITVTFYFEGASDFLHGSFSLLLMFWFLFILMILSIMLIGSLSKDSGRVDVWLHSTASIFELFGVKALFAMMTGIVNFVISCIALILLFSLQAESIEYSYDGHLAEFWISFMSILFFIAIIFMCLSLFIYVLNLVIRPYVKKLTTIITIALFFFMLWIVDLVIGSEAYQKVARFGKFREVSGGKLYFGGDSIYFMIDDSLFYVGELAFSLVFSVGLFVISALLFEKKVRR